MSDRTDGDSIDVLLVEDNPGDVRLTREAFDEGTLSYALHVVTDGENALEFYHQRGEYDDAPRPDLVLLDLNLPRKNGTEVLRAIRNEPTLRSIPVVVLSASRTRDDVDAAYELGANAYLSKPVDPDEFIDAIRCVERFWFTYARLPEVDS